MKILKGLIVAAAAVSVFLPTFSASALTDDRLPSSTFALSQAGREITVNAPRERPRRGEVEVDGTVTRAGRDLRIVSGRNNISVVASSRVPVYYGGRVFNAGNLEVGDRIRILGKLNRSGIHPRVIQVVSSVSDRRDNRDERRGAVTGLVTGIDQRRETFQLRMQNGRTILVDARDTDRQRSDVRFQQLRSGDSVTVLGHFDRSDVFEAESIQVAGGRGRDRDEWRDGRGR